MFDGDLSLGLSLILFALAGAVIAGAGVAIVAVADRLADRTGLGEAVVGGALLGGSTSLSGIVTSMTAASDGHGQLAISNAVGGIAVQTAFLVIGDVLYRRANLEHAAASVTNMTQGALLIALLAVPLIAGVSPPFGTVLGVHPATFVIFLGYGLGLRLATRTHREPMWRPHRTAETRIDTPEEPAGRGAGTALLVLRYLGLALCVGLAGYSLAKLGVSISARSGLSHTVVGAFMTAVATSLPELVTAVAAVRRGALTLAVAGIIGGNTFDVLLVALSDVSYRQGSIYHAMGERELFLIILSILMTAILLLGLIRRERHGIANIGFESVLVLLLYAGGVGLQLYLG